MLKAVSVKRCARSTQRNGQDVGSGSSTAITRTVRELPHVGPMHKCIAMWGRVSLCVALCGRVSLCVAMWAPPRAALAWSPFPQEGGGGFLPTRTRVEAQRIVRPLVVGRGRGRGVIKEMLLLRIGKGQLLCSAPMTAPWRGCLWCRVCLLVIVESGCRWLAHHCGPWPPGRPLAERVVRFPKIEPGPETPPLQGWGVGDANAFPPPFFFASVLLSVSFYCGNPWTSLCHMHHFDIGAGGGGQGKCIYLHFFCIAFFLPSQFASPPPCLLLSMMCANAARSCVRRCAMVWGTCGGPWRQKGDRRCPVAQRFCG